MVETESIKRNPMFVYLAVLTISSTVGLQTWTTLFNNFAVDIAKLGGMVPPYGKTTESTIKMQLKK